MNCGQARIFITTDFLEQGNRHHTDVLQVHLLTCPHCRAFRDDLAHIYKAYQHRDEILPPVDFVQKLKGFYTKKKLTKDDLPKKKPTWIKAVFALGIILLFGGLFYWAELAKKTSGQGKIVAQKDNDQIRQDQVIAAAETTDIKPSAEEFDDEATKPPDTKTEKSDDEGKLSPGFTLVNYDEITTKLSLGIVDLQNADQANSKLVVATDFKAKTDDNKIENIVLDEAIDLRQDGGEAHNENKNKQKNASKDLVIKSKNQTKNHHASMPSQNATDDEIHEPAREPGQDIAEKIVDNILESLSVPKNQESPCALMDKVEMQSNSEFDDFGYNEFSIVRRGLIFTSDSAHNEPSGGNDREIMGQADDLGGDTVILNYKQLYYYINAHTPQGYGRLYSPRSLNKFLNKLSAVHASNSMREATILSDWQGTEVEKGMTEQEDGMTEEDMTEEQITMTKDPAHALNVDGIMDSDIEETYIKNRDPYHINYCPAYPSKSR